MKSFGPILLSILLISACAKTERSYVGISFDLDAVSDSAESGLLAIIRGTKDSATLEVIANTPIDLVDRLSLNEAIPNDPKARLVLLTYAQTIEGVEPTILADSLLSSSSGMTVLTPVAAFVAPLVAGETLVPLDLESPESEDILELAGRIRIPIGMLPSPTPTIVATTVVSPTPSPTVQPTATPTPSPTPTATPTPTPTAIPTPVPTQPPDIGIG